MVAQVSSTVTQIRNMVRRLVASPSTDELSDDDLDIAINTAYSQSMPADIKSTLFKEVVEVYTVPNVDRYALSGTLANNTGPNTYESIRDPVYVEGRHSAFYKDRNQFYNAWPLTKSLNTDLKGSVLSGPVTAIDTSADPVNEITTGDTDGLVNGDYVTFNGVGGSTELNGNTYQISAVTSTTFEITQVGVSAFTSGGTWNKRQVLDLGVPVLQQELNIGGKFGGTYRNYADDGDLSGTGTGQITQVGSSTSVGTVVYATGVITMDFPVPLDSGETISTWYYTYTPAMPYAIMWWKNELVVRPVPDKGYKITMEAFKYPTQFNAEGDTPTLHQWWQYVALIASVKILGERQDMEGIKNIEPLVNQQERLVRNRIANGQIGQRNVTIYEGTSLQNSPPYFWGYF